MRLLPLFLCLGVACSKEQPAQPIVDAAPPAPAVSTAAVVDTGADPETRAKAVVTAWNDALDRHDVAALGGLYASQVSFYGKPMSRDAVLAAKTKAFAAAPNFHQSIVGALAITRDGSVYTAQFTKRSGGGKTSDVTARVVVTDGHVIVESDAPSTERARPKSCEETAGEVVNALPEVKKVLADDAKATAGSKTERMGGIGPEPEPGGGFSSSYGIHTDERYEPHVWYSVDDKGVLSVSAMGGDIAISPAAAAKVRAACK